MSSPVRIGISTASVIFFRRSVYCHGIMSSSQARLYFSSALPSDAAIDADVAEVVRGERHVHADLLADLRRRIRPFSRRPSG